MKACLVTILLVVLALASIPARAGDCEYSYRWKQEGQWWRPVFVRTPCSRSLKITYKVYFPDGSSDQSRFVYMMSSMFTATAEGSQRYEQVGKIVVVDVEWGEVSSRGGSGSVTRNSSRGSSSGGSSGTTRSYPRSTYTGGSGGGEAIAGAGAAVLVAAVAVGTAYMANDVYGNWVVSPSYSGYNVGLKNTTNHHLDFEVGVGVYKARDTDKEPSGIFRVDYPYANHSTNTTFDVNAVYNFLGRSREFGGGSFTFSPYVGLGFSVMTDEDDHFGVGGIVGFSAGVWQNRVQLHARYKWITDYEHTTSAGDPFRLASQFEIGLSVKYKYGWGFRQQIFDDYYYNSDRPVRFGLHVGFNTAAKNYGYKRYDGFYGYNLMVYMMGRLDDSWAINWGMIGINSRGFGYIPMSLNVSREFQFKPLPEWISLVPFAGIQWGFTSKLDRMFNIGPSLGGAVRINQMFDIGAHYDYGVLNMSKYGEHYLRDLQVYTRVFF